MELKDSQIRPASMADLTAIHQLCFQLGYKPTIETSRRGLETFMDHPDYEVVVIVKDSAVLGWMSLCRRYRIEDVPYLQVAALVIDEKIRGQGLGRQLMAYAEKRAREQKLPFVGLYSSKRRNDAHSFYEGIGFERSKESYFFRKDF